MFRDVYRICNGHSEKRLDYGLKRMIYSSNALPHYGAKPPRIVNFTNKFTVFERNVFQLCFELSKKQRFLKISKQISDSR